MLKIIYYVIMYKKEKKIFYGKIEGFFKSLKSMAIIWVKYFLKNRNQWLKTTAFLLLSRII